MPAPTCTVNCCNDIVVGLSTYVMLMPAFAASQYYQITHAGLDAMLQRFLIDMEQFGQLAAANQTVDAQR